MAPEPAVMSGAVRSRVRRSGLSAVLLRLSSPTTGESAGGDTVSDQDETFHWFSAEVEARFRTTHQVSEYAQRLGYSTKTLTGRPRPMARRRNRSSTPGSCSRPSDS